MIIHRIIQTQATDNRSVSERGAFQMKLTARIVSPRWAVVLTLFSSLALSAATDDWEARREEALNRKREVIFNNDGDDARVFPEQWEVTPERFHSLRNIGIVGSRVDSLFYSPGTAIGPLACRNDVGETALTPTIVPGKINITPIVMKQGSDPLQWTQDFCREHGVEFFISLRMNDTHDAAGSPDNPSPLMAKIKLEHPEYLLGDYSQRRFPPYASWSAVDYGRPEVRERVKQVIAGLCRDYDPDGFEYDFFRHMQLFRSVAWGGTATPEDLETMNRFMAELREITEAAGKKRGRPILIAVRVPDSVEYCRAVGIDIERWMKDRSIDMLIGSGYFQLKPWQESVELAHRYGVKFYPSLDESRISAALPPGPRNSNAAYYARALEAVEAGADGIYYFNLFSPARIRTVMLGNRADLELKNKLYYATPRSGSAAESYLHGGSELVTTPWLEPGHSQVITPGNRYEFEMTIGDDPMSPAARAADAKLYAVVRAGGVDKDRLQLLVNGRKFVPSRQEGENFYFYLTPDAVRRGVNQFAIVVAAGESSPEARVILKGDQLLSGANQPPWRRLWSVRGKKGEEIVDNAYRMIDSGTRASECTNLVYPLPHLNGGTLRGTFEMMPDETTAPEAAMLRLALDGMVEMITFEKDRISLKYAGKSVRFPAGSGFHRYEFEFGGGRLVFRGDGRVLFDEAVVMSSDRPEARLSGYEIAIPGMDSSSLILGSLSGPGTGSSRWKNLTIVEDWSVVRDFVLAINYTPPPPPQLAAWANAEPQWITSVDAAELQEKSKEGVARQYRPERLEFADDSVLLKHDNPKVDGMISFTSPKLLTAPPPEILVFEWRVRVECADDTETLAVNLGVPTENPGETLECFFRYSPTTMKLPWRSKHEPLPNGIKTTDWHTYRAVVDRRNCEGALWIDGKVAGYGKIATSTQRKGPFVQLGDGSKGINGNTRFAFFRAGEAVSSPAEQD